MNFSNLRIWVTWNCVLATCPSSSRRIVIVFIALAGCGRDETVSRESQNIVPPSEFTKAYEVYWSRFQKEDSGGASE